MWKYLIRRHSCYIKVAPKRDSSRLIICRLQKAVLRTLRDPDYRMSKSTFQQHPPEQEPPPDSTQFNAHRNSKPDSNCRTCNDFKSWSKQQRLIASTKAAKESQAAGNDKLTAKVSVPREDCPLDKSRLGISTWGLLHTMAAYYADNPTDTEKRDMRTFFDVLSRLYPCEYCAKDFRKDIAVNPVNVNSQKDLALWLCKFHNRVNDKLGKPIFDCSKVNERWRDGWLDGSCD